MTPPAPRHDDIHVTAPSVSRQNTTETPLPAILGTSTACGALRNLTFPPEQRRPTAPRPKAAEPSIVPQYHFLFSCLISYYIPNTRLYPPLCCIQYRTKRCAAAPAGAAQPQWSWPGAPARRTPPLAVAPLILTRRAGDQATAVPTTDRHRRRYEDCEDSGGQGGKREQRELRRTREDWGREKDGPGWR